MRSHTLTRGRRIETSHGAWHAVTLIGNLQQTMTSLEIAELTGKQHKNVIQAIRNMEPAWEKVNGLKFQLVEYRDAKVNFAPATNSPRRSVSTSHGARHAVT